ncbi:IS3 family transposase [Salmonella enterica subsp. enterica serovar Newport]|nr:IS3 family transposase [Salmonella enterica subsp. enterica serovar Newport]EKQ1743184.1 IS3 family transposase [Salmonella enterica]
MMPPYNWSLRQVADDIGVGIATVHGWRKQLELEGLIIRKVEPGAEQSAEQIFTILLETASLSEHELSEYCRKNGLYPEHIAEWKQNCLAANQPKHRQLVDEQRATRTEKSRIRALEKELRRKDKALAEMAALLVLQEKFVSPPGQRRGRLTSYLERQRIIGMIKEAVSNGARYAQACRVAGITHRTFQRWFCDGQLKPDGRPSAQRPEPANKLTENERAQVLQMCSETEFSSLPPSRIVPMLADRGIYLASESTFYRILKAENQLHHRGNSKPRGSYVRPVSYTARGPNQVWSWDITHLPGEVKGERYYLYMIMDVYSRKIVAAEVREVERGEYAAALLQRAVIVENCRNSGLILHSDNGAPMKSFTMLAKMYELGVCSSFSRPRVSNDNPYSESLFRTLKYCPEWPVDGFSNISKAREWVHSFIRWYNTQHRHSGIKFVTPEQRHQGLDKTLLKQREAVYEAARCQHPERWSGKTRNWTPVVIVALNPENERRAA